MGNYYHFVVLPCDPVSPTQKALVEDGVRIAYNRIYAKLRNRTFYSIIELNRAVWELMTRHNQTRMVYVNCHRNEFIKTLFAQDFDVERIVRGLSAFASQTIIAGETFVFLDEVQEEPRVVASLKYFCEDMPELHITVAGSLLGLLDHESITLYLFIIELENTFGKMRKIKRNIVADIPFKVIPITTLYPIFPCRLYLYLHPSSRIYASVNAT